MFKKTSHSAKSRVIAGVLLVIFGGISVMGECLHLLPGLGECCHKPHVSGCACAHPPVSDIFEHDNDACDDSADGFCLVCHFFSLYRCESQPDAPAGSPTVISVLENHVLTPVITALVRQDHARAPPAV